MYFVNNGETDSNSNLKIFNLLDNKFELIPNLQIKSLFPNIILQNLIEFFNLIHLEFKVFFGMMYSKTTKSIQVSPQSYGLFRRMQSPRILKYNFKLQPHTIFVVWNFNIKFSFMKFISSKCIYVLLFVHYFVCLLDVCVIA